MSAAVKRLMETDFGYYTYLEEGLYTVIISYAPGRSVGEKHRKFDTAVNKALDRAEKARKEYLAQRKKRR